MPDDKDKEQNTKLLKDNPQLAEAVAQFIASDRCRQIMSEQILGAIGGDTAQVLAQARQAVDRRIVTPSKQTVITPNGVKKMSMEQCSEYMRCAILQMHNRPFAVREEMDPDGLITQSLTGAVGSAGGYLVPEEVIAEIHARASKSEVVWPLVTKRPTTKDAVKSFEITGYITPNQGAAAKSRSATTTDVIAVTEPTYGEVSWTLRTFDARVPIKLDLLDDAAVNILEHILQHVKDGFVRKRETNVISGTGAAGSLPVGIQNAENGITAVTAANVTSLTNILGWVDDLPQDYRRGGAATALTGSALFFKIVTTLAENVRAAQFLMDALPKIKECVDVSAGKILYGDFSRYIVYFNPLMKMVSSTVAERWTLEMCFQERWDGKVVIEDAFRIVNVTSY